MYLAAARRLLEAEGGALCPGCNMPFDKGRKRKLIDACGHERCYACMFRSDACPLCAAAAAGPPAGAQQRSADAAHPIKKALGSSEPIYVELKNAAGIQTRPKVKTNGHFTSFMQSFSLKSLRRNHEKCSGNDEHKEYVYFSSFTFKLR
ncbi:uncharacterized protein GBIM_06714, partial [Gryllus bimaculatus]